MKDSEVLNLAADVIEQAFCKEAYAIDKDGKRVGVRSPDAVGFCMLGAVARVIGDSINAADVIVSYWVAPLMPKRFTPLGMLGDFIPPHPVREFPITPRAWNDLPSTTQTQVAYKLREASAKAKEQDK